MPDVPQFLIQAQNEIDVGTLAREHRLSTEIARLFSTAFAGFREDLIGDFMDAAETGAEGEASWSLPLAQRLRIQDALLVEYQERIEDAEDGSLELLDEELPEAYEDGYLRYLWLLALGGLAVAARRPDDVDAALRASAIGGYTAQDRIRMWVEQSRVQMEQTLRANIASEHTLPATLAALEPLERKTINGVVGLAANEGYYATQTGMTAASKGYENVPTIWMIRDENACDQCKFLDRKVTTLVPILDTHPACLVGGVEVGHATARATTQRLYEGLFVTVRVASGEWLTVTEHHPVLTRAGWKAAGSLVEGDEVVRCTTRQRVVARIDDHDVKMPSLIAQVEEAFGRARGMASVEVVQAAEHFHGDGTEGQIAHVRAARLLMDRISPTHLKHLPERFFGRRRVRLPDGDRLCHPHSFLLGGDASSRGGVRSSYLLRTLIRRHPLPLQALLFALRPQRHAQPGKVVGDSPPADALVFRELQDRYPGQVAGSQITHVSREFAKRHVYNLETESGFYTGNSVVVANCRCRKIPVPAGFRATPHAYAAFIGQI